MPELKYIVMGTIMAIIQGCILPFYALIFGEYLLALSKSEDKAREMSDFLAILFLGIGILAGVSQFVQIFAFTFSGEALTLRLRKLSFAAILNQEMGWFDDPSRSIGSLCARLSGDAASVNGATGSRIGSLVQALATIIGCCAMAMYQLPKLGGVALAFVPIVLVATYFEGKFMTGQNIGEKKAVEDGSKLAVEAVSNIRYFSLAASQQ
jgi:ATP-binding cassette subfamily B (MDR/TAP) protein 1